MQVAERTCCLNLRDKGAWQRRAVKARGKRAFAKARKSAQQKCATNSVWQKRAVKGALQKSGSLLAASCQLRLRFFEAIFLGSRT